jgi:hypothetical protein
MTLRRRLPITGLAIAACTVLAVAVPTAGTATAASPVAKSDGSHCVFDLEDPAQDGVCFESKDEVNAYVEAQAEVILVEVYDWVGLNADGPHRYGTGTSACTATTNDVDYRVSTLYGLNYDRQNPNGVSMNDTYSSLITRNECDIRLSDWVNNNPDPDNPKSGWIDYCTNLNGSGQGDCPSVLNWNDRASSFVLS